jgi:hypothetical protein
MDNLVFEESVNTEVDSSEFISKKWIYVNDSNSGNYTSQIVIDSTPLSNAGGYINWQEGYILIPLVVQLSSTTAASLGAGQTTGLNTFALKNSFIQMINSMNIEFNNQNLVQAIPLTNVFRCFKLLTSYSQNDLVNNGVNYGFFPDDVASWTYITTEGPSGSGLCNNTAANTAIDTRNAFWNYDPTVGNTLDQDLVNNLGSCTSVYRSSLVSNIAGSRTWHIYAKLRLKDLNEFFEKAPLLKGATIRFYINTNQTIIRFSSDGTNYVDAGTSINVLGGLTNPLMLRPISATNVLVNDTYALSISIFRNNNVGVNGQVAAQSSLQSCRLYAPIYKFNPIAEQRYLSLAPTKKIEYNDIFQYQFSNIDADENFNVLVSNGIPNIQSVLVIPLISPVGNTTSFNTLLSPFTTTPGTPDPITLTNFNLLISGVNLFLNNELYDFEAFTQQLINSNQLNGNLTTGLTSGLISESAFQRGYRYYYGNCARQLPSEMGVSRSVQVIGQNKSLLNINLLVFVEFKRSITIDILTGARIE